MGSISGLVKPETVKLAFVGYPLYARNITNGLIGSEFRIMCPDWSDMSTCGLLFQRFRSIEKFN
jgi:hypothetical protein